MTFEVVRPGAQTTLQDLGRWGWQRFGVPVCGAMDERSHRLANALVGNRADDATLEIVLSGPSLVVHETVLVAVCGADLAPTVTGRTGRERLPHGRPVWVRAGGRIEFGQASPAGDGRSAGGLRAVLAVRGGFDVPLVMGSRSTYLRGGFGGLAGRALQAGDRLAAGPRRVVGGEPVEPGTPASSSGPSPIDLAAPVAAAFARSISGCVLLAPTPLVVPPVALAEIETVRVVAGAEWDVFDNEARAAFVAAAFTVGPQSDRMGYRLQGPTLARARTIEMISEAVTFGSVQVPPDGQPIVLMADRQTTGGYPRIAEVAGADLPLLAQMAPGQRLRFALVTLADAQRILVAREREYSHVAGVMRAPPARRPRGGRGRSPAPTAPRRSS